MFDTIKKISVILKNLSIITFFCVCSLFLVKLSDTVASIEDEVTQTNSMIRTEIPLLREEVFNTTNNALVKIDNRFLSVERAVFSRIDTIEKKAFTSIDRLHSNLDNITEESISLSRDYRTIPANLNAFMKPINSKMSCTDNDSCWPNLFTDVMIDTRNTARTASSSFILFNREIPKITSDFNKISTSLSVGMPMIIDNTTKVTDNINRLTTPKWYDRLIGATVNGSLVWYNVSRSLGVTK